MTALIDLYKVNHQSLVDWVCKTYGIGLGVGAYGNPHRLRREVIADRLRLYRDQVTLPLCRVIETIYETEEMKALLKRYIPVAREQNVTRRIVNEVASLYDRPALRILKNRDEQFRLEEKRLNLHFVQQEGHRLTNLCNETLLWQFNGIDDKTALRLITPDAFDAIPDTRDKLVPAGFLLDSFPITALPPEMSCKLPHYEVWDDTFRYLINAEGRLVDADGTITTAPIEHKVGRIPGVLFHRREPTVTILDADYGEDIKSAHLSVGLLRVMIMRLAKSQGEQQPVLQGHLAAVASGQVLNGEKPLLLPPDVVASMLDMKTEPDHYLSVKRDVLMNIGASYGLAYETLINAETTDTASGKAYQVRREKLTELRVEQRMRAVKHEEEVIRLMGFEPTGMRIDFQEQAIPLDAGEEVDLLERKMKMGLDSIVAYMMRKDTDLSREEALKRIRENIRDYAGMIQWVRALNVPGDADLSNPGQSPQQNGAANSQRALPAARTLSDQDKRAAIREALHAA